MSRRALVSIIGLLLLAGAGFGGYWLAERTVLAQDEIRVRIARATLIKLISRDMVGAIKGGSGIVRVTLPRLDPPQRLLLIDLDPKALKRHGVARSAVVAAIREKVAQVKSREPPASIEVRAHHVAIALPDFGSLNPKVFEAVKKLRFGGAGGDVWIRRLGRVNVAVAPGVTEKREREFPLVRIGIESRWRYPEARRAVSAYLDGHAKWAPGKPRRGKLYEFVTGRR